MPLDVGLCFQDASFPLPATSRFQEPEELKLQHPVVSICMPFQCHPDGTSQMC